MKTGLNKIKNNLEPSEKFFYPISINEFVIALTQTENKGAAGFDAMYPDFEKSRFKSKNI